MPEDVQTDTTNAQPDSGPVTVQYPSGHTVSFPSEAHAQAHAASVWDQLKDEWNTVKNWQGVEAPNGEDRKTGAAASPFGQSVIDKVKNWHDEASSALEEAGANLGRLPAELLSGAKNIQAYMPSPYGQKPAMESMEETAKREHPILSGVGEGTGRFVGGLMSPTNVAIMAAMPEAEAIPLLNKALSAGFAAGMSRGALEQARSVIANWTKMTPQQRTAALTTGGLQTILAGLATIHTVGEASSVPADVKALKAELKGESGEMIIPGTGGTKSQTVGTAKGAEEDTRYFNEAKAENPDKSLSDWMRIAQEKKLAAKLPVRPLTAADRAAAVVPDVNEKGQKLGIKPIEVTGEKPVIDKTGHPDYNEKGQLLGIPPEVEDIGGKVRAEQPFSRLMRLLGSEKGEAKIPFTGNMMDEDEEPGPVWFSKAENTIAEKVPNNASGDAVRSVLINNGVKPDEMKWSGLDDYLEGKPKISKADLQRFIAENKLNLNEVTYGGQDQDTQALRDQHQRLANLQDHAIQTVNQAYGRLESPVPLNTFLSGTPGERAEWLSKMSPAAAEAAQKYEGLEEQRSAIAEKMSGFRLVVNPEETAHAGAAMYDVVNPQNNVTQMTGDRHAVNEYMNEHSELMKKSVASKYEKWTVPGEKTKYTEKLLTLPQKVSPNYDAAKKAYADSVRSDDTSYATLARQQELFQKMQALKPDHYIAPHFQQESNPNIVAHVRYSDRPAVDGKKTMFLEEAQSDWHTDIRHKGYTGEYAENAARINELERKARPALAAGGGGQELSEAEQAELTKLKARNADIYNEGDDKTPNAPFHQNWHELAMKRMLREAAEKGYDRLAWTTGKQQADLYSLARHFSKLEYEPDTNTLVIHEHNGKVHREDVSPDVKSLTPYVGQDLAEKLVDKIDSYDPGPSEDQLYQDYLDQYSVEQEEQEPEYVVTFGEHGDTEYFDSEGEAEKALKKWWEKEHPYHDPETGEWIAPEKGEERENDDNQDDIEPPTIETQERLPSYVIMRDGEVVDSGFDTSREANRVMGSMIHDDVRSARDDYEQELPSLSGLDLKRGGEFHKLLYDTMIPSFLKKYGKKWGAEVKDVEMKGMAPGKNIYEGPELSLRDLDEKVADVEPLLSMREAERLQEIKDLMRRQSLSFQDAMNKVAERGPKGIHDLAERFGGKIVAHPSHEKVHSIEITPQLRRSVLKGQPIAKNEAAPVEQNA